MRRPLLTVIALTLAAGAPQAVIAAPARADSLRVLRATVYPDQARVVLTIRCRAPHARCSGTLRTEAIDGQPLTAATRVRLAPGHAQRLAVPLRADGLRGMAESGPEPIGIATLSAGGRRIAGDFTLRASPTCRTGAALAASAQVRVFRVLGFGVYACLRPVGRPALVAAEDDSISPVAVEAVVAAGQYVAVSVGLSWKCASSTIVLYDVRARRRVRELPTHNTVDSSANGCTGTTDAVALLLRPSGAMAWSEAAGDDHNVTIRSVDASGLDETLDSAPDVDARSLHALDPERIGWTRAGARRTATLR
jgi:hypothetical protein